MFRPRTSRTSPPRGRPRNDQRPRTPPHLPNHALSNRGYAAAEHSPVDNGRDFDSTDDDERDPHDLSLNPKHIARTSVVDNMLLSLDQFSAVDLNSNRDGPSYQLDTSSPYSRHSNYGRYHSLTLSSSVSSDVETYSAESAGTYTRPHMFERRSNSSSNNHPTVRQIHGSNEGDKLSNRIRTYELERAAAMGDSVSVNRASPMTSKNSVDGRSNIDLNYQKLTKGRRSASFDYGSKTFPTPAPEGNEPFDQWDAELDYDDINAAPTPTVPVGPRRNYSRSVNQYSTNHPPRTSPHTPALSRKNSAKSTKSMYARAGRSGTLGTGTVKGRNDEQKRFGDSLVDIPPVPALAQQPAPSPTIARHKSSYVAPITESSTPPPKERQGFFRRVFGSSRHSSPSQTDRTPQYSQENDHVSSNGHHTSKNNSKLYSQSQRDLTASENNKSNRENPHVVMKKPSSFFRRRKKSVTDQPPPSFVLPHSNLSSVEHSKGDPLKYDQSKPGNEAADSSSPTSSLTNVMKPFLPDFDSQEYHVTGLDQNLQDTDDIENEISGHDFHHPTRYKPRTESRKPERSNTSHSSMAGTGDARSNVTHNTQNDKLDGATLENHGANEGLSGRHPYDKNRFTMSSTLNATHKPFQPTDENGKQSRTIREVSDTSILSSLFVPPNTSNNTKLNQTPGPVRSNTFDTDCQRLSSENDASESILARHEIYHGDELVTKGADRSPRTSISTNSNYHTASSTPIIPDPGKDSGFGAVSGQQSSTAPVESTSLGEEPNSEDREQAQKLFDETDDEIIMEKCTAAWLGTPNRPMIRKAYMDLFDWSEMNILAGLRSLCSKIALKGEAQQVDRVLDVFSARWCECNPNHGFMATDVVHTICYSLLLLNTDLHFANIEQKMTRTQFIRNTMPTVQRVVADAAPDAFNLSQSDKPLNKQVTESDGLSTAKYSTLHPEGPHVSGVDNMGIHEVDDDTSKSGRSITMSSKHSTRNSYIDGGPLVSAPFNGTMKAWETQIESVLKEFYTLISKQKLPLRGIDEDNDENVPSNNFLTLTGNMLRRTPSTLSRTGSDINSRGRAADNRLGATRWPSKARSRTRHPMSTMASSRTTLDDQSSLWSPSASSTWSKNSLNKTLTSMSVGSVGSEYPRGDYQQSIGFANALSHAIIREESSNSVMTIEEPTRPGPILEDESLELAGAPWAKEGSLKHKHHLDSIDKRAKDRIWNENFAVIQRGWMRLFSFNSSSKSTRLKPKQRQNAGLVVGGGNWMENAEETWKFLLRHTIASALPAPGYSKSRPHVWALSLPTGAVHLFQVGTPEIVKEFVSTANYWSARLSKEPLFGAISNVEYGWSDSVISNAVTNSSGSRSSSISGPRHSRQSSIRSSIDQQTVRPRLPSDRLFISDWRPPQQSMMASNTTETEQLEILRKYVKYVEEELQRHNELRGPMTLSFTPRHANYTKSLNNWERKSSYLLREIVKFRTYIDCLQGAQLRKEKIYQSANKESNGSDERTG